MQGAGIAICAGTPSQILSSTEKVEIMEQLEEEEGIRKVIAMRAQEPSYHVHRDQCQSLERGLQALIASMLKAGIQSNDR